MPPKRPTSARGRAPIASTKPPLNTTANHQLRSGRGKSSASSTSARKGSKGRKKVKGRSKSPKKKNKYAPLPPIDYKDPDEEYFDAIRKKAIETEHRLKTKQREREEEQLREIHKSFALGDDATEIFVAPPSNQKGSNGPTGTERDGDNVPSAGAAAPVEGDLSSSLSHQHDPLNASAQLMKSLRSHKVTETYTIPQFQTRKRVQLQISLLFDKELSAVECMKEANQEVLTKIARCDEEGGISETLRKAFIASLGEDYGEKLTPLQFKCFIRDAKLVDMGVSVSAMNIMFNNVTKPLTYMNETSFVLSMFFLAAMVCPKKRRAQQGEGGDRRDSAESTNREGEIWAGGGGASPQDSQFKGAELTAVTSTVFEELRNHGQSTNQSSTFNTLLSPSLTVPTPAPSDPLSTSHRRGSYAAGLRRASMRPTSREPQQQPSPSNNNTSSSKGIGSGPAPPPLTPVGIELSVPIGERGVGSVSGPALEPSTTVNNLSPKNSALYARRKSSTRLSLKPNGAAGEVGIAEEESIMIEDPDELYGDPVNDEFWSLRKFCKTILEPYAKDFLPQWCDPTVSWSEDSPGCERVASIHHGALKEMFDMMALDESHLKKYAKPVAVKEQGSNLRQQLNALTKEASNGGGGFESSMYGSQVATKPKPSSTASAAAAKKKRQQQQATDVFKPRAETILSAMTSTSKIQEELDELGAAESLPSRHEHFHAVGSAWNTFLPLSGFTRFVSSMHLSKVVNGDIIRAVRAASLMHPLHHFRQRMTASQKARTEEEPFLLFPEFVDALIRVSVVAFRPSSLPMGAHVGNASSRTLDESSLSAGTQRRLRAVRERSATGIKANEREARAASVRTLVDAFRNLMETHVAEIYEETTQRPLTEVAREHAPLDPQKSFFDPPAAIRLLPPGIGSQGEVLGPESNSSLGMSSQDSPRASGQLAAQLATATAHSRPGDDPLSRLNSKGSGGGVGANETMALTFRPMKHDVIVQNPLLRQEITLLGEQFEINKGGLTLAVTTPAAATLLDKMGSHMNAPGAQRYISANTSTTLSIAQEGFFSESSTECRSFLTNPLVQIKSFDLQGPNVAKFMLPALCELKQKTQAVGQPFFCRMATYVKTDAARRTRVFRHRIYSFHLHYSNDGKRWVSARSPDALREMNVVNRLSDPHVVKYNEPLPPETIPGKIVSKLWACLKKIASIRDPLNSGYLTRHKYDVTMRHLWGSHNLDGRLDQGRYDCTLQTDIHTAFRSFSTICGKPPEPQYKEALGIDEFLSCLIFLYRRDVGVDPENLPQSNLVEAPPINSSSGGPFGGGSAGNDHNQRDSAAAFTAFAESGSGSESAGGRTPEGEWVDPFKETAKPSSSTFFGEDLSKAKKVVPDFVSGNMDKFSGASSPAHWWRFLSDIALELEIALGIVSSKNSCEERDKFISQIEQASALDAKPILSRGAIGSAAEGSSTVNDPLNGTTTSSVVSVLKAGISWTVDPILNPERLVQQLNLIKPRPQIQLDIYQGPFRIGRIESLLHHLSQAKVSQLAADQSRHNSADCGVTLAAGNPGKVRIRLSLAPSDPPSMPQRPASARVGYSRSIPGQKSYTPYAPTPNRTALGRPHSAARTTSSHRSDGVPVDFETQTKVIKHHDLQMELDRAKQCRNNYLHGSHGNTKGSVEEGFEELPHEYLNLDFYNLPLGSEEKARRILSLNLPFSATIDRLRVASGFHFFASVPSGTPDLEILRIRVWKLTKRIKQQTTKSTRSSAGDGDRSTTLDSELSEQDLWKAQYGGGSKGGDGTSSSAEAILGGGADDLEGKCVGCLSNFPGQLSTLDWIPTEGDLKSPIASLCLYSIHRQDPNFAAMAAAFLTHQHDIGSLRSAIIELGFDLEVVHPV